MSELMTKYEKARVLGLRATQIGNGAKAMVDPKGERDSLRIALMELRAGVLDMSVRRHFPDGTFRDIHVNQMIIP